jgi:hypothetical protein
MGAMLRFIAAIALGCLLAACSGSVQAPGPEAAPDSGGVDAAQPADAGAEGLGDTASELPAEAADADAESAAEDSGPPLGILEALSAIDGMQVLEQSSSVYGCRFFRLVYQQPANHQNPAGPQFGQRMARIHCSPNYPMVLGTTGYSLWSEDQAWELTAMLGANQLVVEHRFFDASIPESPYWPDLTIRNAAADHHRIVQALRPLYPAAWISTGASKGGMTSVYHRRFHPDDVDATVAYVAPHSHGVEDPRYALFLEQVGDPGCRAKLKNLQREVLLRRPAMLQRMTDLASQNGWSYQWLGQEIAFEHAVTEFWFYFWQYYDASLCGSIPGSGASNDALFVFLDSISPMSSVSDATISFFSPYFYQAATQLGGPGQADAHIADLLKYPGTDVPASYAPKGWPAEFEPGAMLDIETWLGTEGSRVMFVYGENDPWSAAAFPLGQAKDTYVFTVPAGNHYSQLQELPAAERAQALALLEKWTGVKPKPPPPVPSMLTYGPRPRL